jgi:hypothetical protein
MLMSALGHKAAETCRPVRLYTRTHLPRRVNLIRIKYMVRKLFQK